MLEVAIRDNGQSFEPGKPRRNNAFGIIGMQERALMLNGTLETSSAPGRATLCLRFPPGTSTGNGGEDDLCERNALIWTT